MGGGGGGGGGGGTLEGYQNNSYSPVDHVSCWESETVVTTAHN